MIRKKLKSNKGFAIETALITGVILFLLCTLICTATLRQSIRNKKSNVSMNVPSLIEQYGEDFYKNVINSSITALDNKEIEIDENTYYETITINTNVYELKILDKDDNLILNVIVKDNKITKWYFDKPQND